MGDMLLPMSFFCDKQHTWWYKLCTLTQNIAFSLCVAIDASSQCSSVHLIFNWDMIIDVQVRTNWDTRNIQHATIQDRGLIHKNSTRVPHNYCITDQILIIKSASDRKYQQKIVDPVKGGSRHIMQVSRNRIIKIRTLIKKKSNFFSNFSNTPYTLYLHDKRKCNSPILS